LRTIPALILVLIPIGLFIVSSQTSAAPLDEVSVIGTRLPGVSKANVLFIEHDIIRSYAGISTLSALQNNPLTFTQAGSGRGTYNSLYLRGADPNFTLIQIDGLPVNDLTDNRGGAVDMGNFGLLGIESIEILPGASSAVYGSQALGGVINIKTRNIVGTELYGQVSPSGDGYRSGLVWGDGQWNVSSLYERDDNEATRSSYTGRSLVVKRSTEIDSSRQLDIRLRYSDNDSDAYPDDSGGALFTVSPKLESRNSVQKQIGANYRAEYDGGSEFSFKTSYSEIALNVDTPAVLPGLRDPFGLPAIRSDNHYEATIVSMSYLSKQVGNLRVLGGVNYERSSGKSNSVIDIGFELPASFVLRREQWGAFTEMVWRPIKQITVSGGGRIERFQDNEIFTPLLNAEYTSLNKRHTVMLSWGEGFKLPSFYALGNPLVGNPELENESSNSLEFRYSFESMHWMLGISVFRNKFKNLVDFEAGPPPSLINRDKVEITGAELQVRLLLSSALELTAFASMLDIEVINQPTLKLRGRPESRIGLGLQWKPNSDFQLNLRARYSGNIPDSSVPTGNIPIEPANVLDATASYALTPSFIVNGSLENVLGEDYQTSIGNFVQKPTMYVGFRYKL
jgi:vitamin B12 transporter